MDPITRRTFLRLSSLSVVLPVATTATVFAKDDIQRFRDLYSSLKTISLSFSSSAAKGTLVAKAGGMYRIELGEKKFVCNGQQIWTVSAKTKTIVIDAFDSDNDQMSIERVFFVLLNVYRPKKISKSVIQLTPPDPSATVAGVEKVECTVDSKMRISSIRVFEGGSPTTWKISNLKVNKNVNNGQFTVTPETGWDVIDLR